MAQRDQNADDWSRRCEQCGALIPDEAHWRRDFCSRRCANAHFNGLTGQARSETRAGLKCVVCNEPIVGAERSDKKYCSNRCAQTVYLATFVAKKPEKNCAHCGAVFKSQFATAKYCSPTCYRASRYGPRGCQPQAALLPGPSAVTPEERAPRADLFEEGFARRGRI